MITSDFFLEEMQEKAAKEVEEADDRSGTHRQGQESFLEAKKNQK